jgi:uncharacterized Zn finger protein
MPKDEISVKFDCSKCGKTTLEVSEPVTDNSTVKCKSCGAEFGRWRDVKAKATKVVADKVKADFKKAFKGMKGFTVK